MTIETANRLYELRKKQGLSQEELAEKLGVSRQAVSKWERSEASPDTDNLIALAKLYGLSLDELIYGDKQSDENQDKKKEGSDNSEDQEESKENTPESEPEKKGFKINVNLSLDDDDLDEEEKELIRQSGGKATFWVKLPYPIICVIAYLLFGALDILGGWAFFWIIFLTIPLYYTLIDAIFKKRVGEFAYPVFTAFAYLYLGLYHSIWHPSWIVFITIPVYYSIASAIDKKIKRGTKK